MLLTFRKSTKSNICPTKNAKGESVLVVAQPDLTAKQVAAALEEGIGRFTEVDDKGRRRLMIGYGEVAFTVNIKADVLKGIKADAGQEVEIEEVEA